MSAATTTKTKAQLLAESAANLKRSAALVEAFSSVPDEVKQPAMPANRPQEEVHLNVHEVKGEAIGVTAVKKILKNHLQPALALSDLVYRSPATLRVEDICTVLRENSERAASGDLSDLQGMLAAQAVVLDGIFAEFARRAALCKKDDDLDRMLRIALKAQSQSRTTVESLAVIQQGPKIFAKQANVSNGGNQQVNNHAPATPKASRTRAVKVKAAKQTIGKVAP